MKQVNIEVKGLCKTFVSEGENYNVIKNLDLKIYKGDFTVIMGSSGAGKSTLMYLLSGMDEGSAGEVTLLGNKLSKASRKQMEEIRREKISFVFQGINLISDLNAFENIAAPTFKMKTDKRKLSQEIDELLNRFSMSEQSRKYPSQLSGGQKQKIAICRALINKPEIIFADEPTGALNSNQGQEVLNILTELNNDGQSIVMVTHDLKAAIRANRLLYIKDGRIDGDMSLPPFDKDDYEERGRQIFQFLKEKGW